MKNIKDILEYKEIDLERGKRKWMVFRDDFLQANKDFIVYIIRDNNEWISQIVTTLYKNKELNLIENLKETSTFSDAKKIAITNEEEFEKFYNEFRLNYYTYNLFYSDALDMFMLMDDDDAFHIVCHKNALRQVFELDEIFATDANIYETFEYFKNYNIAILKLYADYFFSKRITIDDFKLLQPAPEGYWKDGEWILKEDPKKDSSVDNK